MKILAARLSDQGMSQAGGPLVENTPADRVRFAVLGFGKIARTRFLPAVARVPSVCLTAIGTRHPDQLNPESLPVAEPPRVLSYDELMRAGRDLVDVVYIALPNDMHEEWTLRGAEAGLHVLCEKPLAATKAAAWRCREACRARGLLLAEAFMYRYDPRHHRVQELITTGWLGHVHLLEASFSYVLEDLSNIRLRADRQGGALMDVGCYGIDVARFLLGAEPVEVMARCVRGADSGVDELVAVTLLFASGTVAVVTASTHLARYHAYRIRGTQGTVTVPHAFIPNDKEPTQILIESANAARQVEDFPPFAPFEAEIMHYAQAVRAKDAALLPPAEDGVATAAVLEAIIQSMGTGLHVDLMKGRP